MWFGSDIELFLSPEQIWALRCYTCGTNVLWEGEIITDEFWYPLDTFLPNYIWSCDLLVGIDWSHSKARGRSSPPPEPAFKVPPVC